MMRGTTPTIRMNLTHIDPATVAEAYLTIKQPGYTLEKSLSDATVGETYLEWSLAQTETLALQKQPTCQIQARYRLTSGKAYASRIFNIRVDDILKEGEI